jgi:hypothetical protein
MLGGLQPFGALGMILGPVLFATAAALGVLRDTSLTDAPDADSHTGTDNEDCGPSPGARPESSAYLADISMTATV